MVLVAVVLVALARFTTVYGLSDFQTRFATSEEEHSRVHDRVLVNLGYATYAGVRNESTGLNVFKGIRFAAPPTGELRWQAPQPPAKDNGTILDASSFSAACPHSLRAGQVGRVLPSPISEDCLFLNVYAPINASSLPVLFYIHGGGYGVGDGRQDLTKLINANDNTFVAVSIQYRLGALGFLASHEVSRSGVVNAGLLDQRFALQWVQDHIETFGGDPRKVTIFGISAGGGSVMLHDIAKDGSLGTSLFTNSISFSPYLPQQHTYTNVVPSQAYYAFATHAGCAPSQTHGNTSHSIFQCLVASNTDTLQAASNAVSISGIYGTWAFLPVTDGTYIRSRPSDALSAGKKLNGLAHLSSNVAEESFVFVPQTIDSKARLETWIHRTFPLFFNDDITALHTYYPYQDASSTLKFATSGDAGASALGTSATATGYQQLANLIYAESTFICPSYWLASAYGNRGYKMSFSVPIALHGYDGIALFGTAGLPTFPESLTSLLQRIVGTFVATGSMHWPAFTAPEWPMLNVNVTGGRAVPVENPFDAGVNGVGAEWMVGMGLEGYGRVVDGRGWEAGRGKRCGFWRDMTRL